MQFAHIDSLRDIQNGLRSLSLEKNQLNIGRVPCKSSLSHLNKKLDAAFFEDLYFNLLEKLECSLRKRRIYVRKLKRGHASFGGD
jgi:hypothetical protein